MVSFAAKPPGPTARSPSPGMMPLLLTEHWPLNTLEAHSNSILLPLRKRRHRVRDSLHPFLEFVRAHPSLPPYAQTCMPDCRPAAETGNPLSLYAPTTNPGAGCSQPGTPRERCCWNRGGSKRRPRYYECLGKAGTKRQVGDHRAAA